jgi:hypothetical protein
MRKHINVLFGCLIKIWGVVVCSLQDGLGGRCDRIIPKEAPEWPGARRCLLSEIELFAVDILPDRLGEVFLSVDFVHPASCLLHLHLEACPTLWLAKSIVEGSPEAPVHFMLNDCQDLAFSYLILLLLGGRQSAIQMLTTMVLALHKRETIGNDRGYGNSGCGSSVHGGSGNDDNSDNGGCGGGNCGGGDSSSHSGGGGGNGDSNESGDDGAMVVGAIVMAAMAVATTTMAMVTALMTATTAATTMTAAAEMLVVTAMTTTAVAVMAVAVVKVAVVARAAATATTKTTAVTAMAGVRQQSTTKSSG